MTLRISDGQAMHNASNKPHLEGEAIYLLKMNYPAASSGVSTADNASLLAMRYNYAPRGGEYTLQRLNSNFILKR